MARLILLIILFLLSLLSIFPAPAYPFWLLAILVTEYPLIFIFLTLIILLSGKWLPKWRTIGNGMGLVALILFSSPVIKAFLVAKTLARDMGGSTNLENPPFSISNLFNGLNTKNVAYQEFNYSKKDQAKLNLKFFPSQKKGLRPCVVVIHGGSWKSGDNDQLPELNSYLATEGYHVAAINYRLAPKYKSPCQLEDVKQALNFLKEHSEEFAIDTSKFVLLGRSAGAQVALLAAYTFKESGIKAVIDFYGPADMVWGYSVPSNPLIMNSRKVMEDYLGGSYDQVPCQYQESSPLLYAGKNSVPTLIIHGENDVLVAYEHSRRLYKKLTNKGVYSYLLSLSWATHGFDYNINGPGGQLSTYVVTTFLRKVCCDI